VLNIVLTNLEKRFDVFVELLAKVDDTDFHKKLDVPKNKSIAEHLWCVIGARQSFARAIQAGEWQGFDCSLDAKAGTTDYKAALDKATTVFHQTVKQVDDWTEDRQALLAKLYEHEVIHEGQLIRHVYGMGLSMPSSSQWA